MTRGQRILGAIGLVILGGLAMVFVGTQVTSCLGPLGRTLVQSIADGCIKPGVGPAMPVAALWLAAAALLLVPMPRSMFRGAALGAVVGAAVAAVSWAVLPPTSMTGPTSYGDVITIALAFDWNLLLAALIAGATLGLIVGSRLLLRRSPGLAG
jgi:hypothetical protein